MSGTIFVIVRGREEAFVAEDLHLMKVEADVFA